MPRHAWSIPILVLALSGGAISEASPQTLELASRGPRFIASWTKSGEALDVSSSVVLRRRVSLDLTNVTADEALKEITRQADLEISYSKAMLPSRRSVSLHAREITVAAALTEVLLDAGVDVAVARGGHMALVKRPASATAEVLEADSGSIAGRVTDKSTGAPIIGATVVIAGMRYSATTDADGRYLITDVPAGSYRLQARYIGYAPLMVSVTVSGDAEAEVDIELEKSVQQLEDVVTTGTVVPTEIKALPTPVTVVTAHDIAQQQPRSLQQLFRQTVPGAFSLDELASPDVPAFSVRGATTLSGGTTQMKVFVDGIETAFPNRETFALRSIERVEVVRGPQAAAIYGSDAIGGVMQIFTKRGDPTLSRPNVEAEASMGLIQTPYAGFGGVLRQQYAASVRGGAPDVGYSLGASYMRTGDWLPNGELSGQSHPSAFGAVRFARDIVSVDVSGRYNVVNAPGVTNPDVLTTGFVPLSRPQFTTGKTTSQTVGVRFTLTPLQWWQHTLTAGIDNHTEEAVQSRARLTTPDDTLLSVFDIRYSKRSIGYNTSVNGLLSSAVSGSLTVGIDHYSLPINNLSTASALTTVGTIAVAEGGSIGAYRLLTRNTGVFAQAQLGLRERLFITAGLRGEWNTEFGDSLDAPLSPRVGASYVAQLGETTLKARGSWGRAIRAPNPQLKLSQGPDILPNLELGPERQRGWDAGLDLVFGTSGSLGLTYYDQTADNVIQFVRVQNEPTPLDQFQNVGRVKNRGVEIEASLSVGVVDVRANYAYTRARIDALGPNYSGELRVGQQAQLTPKHTAGALVSVAPRPGTTLTAGMAYVGSFAQTDFLALFHCLGGTGECTPDFTFVVTYPGFVKINSTLWQAFTPRLSGFLQFDNLTNNRAFEFGNIAPVSGRTSTLGLRFQY